MWSLVTQSVAKCDKYCQDIDYFQKEAARLSVCIHLCIIQLFYAASALHKIKEYNCLLQRELQESEMSVESMKRLKATAEQQKRDVDKQCAMLQVFYSASLSEPLTSYNYSSTEISFQFWLCMPHA